VTTLTPYQSNITTSVITPTAYQPEIITSVVTHTVYYSKITVSESVYTEYQSASSSAEPTPTPYEGPVSSDVTSPAPYQPETSTATVAASPTTDSQPYATSASSEFVPMPHEVKYRPTTTPAAHLEARERDWRANRDKAISKGRQAGSRGRKKGQEGREKGQEGRRKGQADGANNARRRVLLPEDFYPAPGPITAAPSLHARERDWRADRDKAISKGRQAGSRGRAKGQEGRKKGQEQGQAAAAANARRGMPIVIHSEVDDTAGPITAAPQIIHARERDWRADRDKAISKGRQAGSRGRAKGQEGRKMGQEQGQAAAANNARRSSPEDPEEDSSKPTAPEMNPSRLAAAAEAFRSGMRGVGKQMGPLLPPGSNMLRKPFLPLGSPGRGWSSAAAENDNDHEGGDNHVNEDTTEQHHQDENARALNARDKMEEFASAISEASWWRDHAASIREAASSVVAAMPTTSPPPSHEDGGESDEDDKGCATDGYYHGDASSFSSSSSSSSSSSASASSTVAGPTSSYGTGDGQGYGTASTCHGGDDDDDAASSSEQEEARPSFPSKVEPKSPETPDGPPPHPIPTMVHANGAEREPINLAAPAAAGVAIAAAYFTLL
jgi:hypothetical protein